MAKDADGPKSGRMGFGYRQARDAGAPYTRQRPWYETGAELADRHTARDLRKLVEENPHLSSPIKEMIAAGFHPSNILREAELILKTGSSPAYRMLKSFTKSQR